MCVFVILLNKKNTKNIYYADGQTAHAHLLNSILDKFGKEIGCNNRFSIPDNFFEKWTIKKGFIDPSKKGFSNFEKIFQAIKKDFLRHKKENNLSEETIKKLEKGEKIESPNWFIVDNSH